MTDDEIRDYVATSIKQVPAAVKQVKAGYKSTEFWTSLLAKGVSIAAGVATGGKLGAVLAVAGTVLSALGYSTSRGMTKK